MARKVFQLYDILEIGNWDFALCNFLASLIQLLVSKIFTGSGKYI
jgi:hypothetical protein